MTNLPLFQFQLEQSSPPFSDAVLINSITLVQKEEISPKPNCSCYFGYANEDPALKVYATIYKQLNYFFKIHNLNTNTIYNFCLLDNCAYLINYTSRQKNTIKQHCFGFLCPIRIIKLNQPKQTSTQPNMLTKIQSHSSIACNAYINYLISNLDKDAFAESAQNLEDLFRIFCANTIFSYVQKRQANLNAPNTHLQHLLNKIKTNGINTTPRTKHAFEKAINKLDMSSLETFYNHTLTSIQNSSVFSQYPDDISLYTNLLNQEKFQEDEIIL